MQRSSGLISKYIDKYLEKIAEKKFDKIIQDVYKLSLKETDYLVLTFETGFFSAEKTARRGRKIFERRRENICDQVSPRALYYFNYQIKWQNMIRSEII